MTIPHNSEDNHYNGLNPQLEADKELKKEYLSGIDRLKRLIRGYGLTSIALVAVGSLTRHDKGIRYNPKEEFIDSDADFVCIVKSPFIFKSLVGLNLLRTGQAVVLKQENEGKSLPKFSEHIPYFQVEFLTEQQCLKILQIQTGKLQDFKDDFFKNPPQSRDDFFDVLETIRSFKSAFIIYRHLDKGVLFDGEIPEKIKLINDQISLLFREIYLVLEDLRVKYP